MKEGIAVAGSVLVDKINEIAAYPDVGELTKILSVGFAVGGMVPNDGIDLKKMRPSLPVFAIGKVGADGEGEYVVEKLQEHGVDTDGIVVAEQEKTSFTDVMSVVGGQRTFFTYAGASAKFGYEDIDFGRLQVKMLHLGYFLLLDKVDGGDGLRILQEAKKHGIKTSIDLVSENSDRYALVAPCLPYVDNLIINETEGARLCGEDFGGDLVALAKALKALGVRERVILHTPVLGVCFDGKKVTSLPSYDLPKGYIKGTTGAGDAFCSGALLGIYEDKTDEEILHMATVAATCSLGTADATSGITDYEQMQEFCKNLKRKRIC